MQIETKTRTRVNKQGEREVIMEIGLLPRGSGNRNKARGIAAWYANHPELKPHILSIKAGTSKVTVHFRPSLELMKLMMEYAQRQAMAKDVEGQMALFGVT